MLVHAFRSDCVFEVIIDLSNKTYVVGTSIKPSR